MWIQIKPSQVIVLSGNSHLYDFGAIAVFWPRQVAHAAWRFQEGKAIIPGIADDLVNNE